MHIRRRVQDTLCKEQAGVSRGNMEKLEERRAKGDLALVASRSSLFALLPSRLSDRCANPVVRPTPAHVPPQQRQSQSNPCGHPNRQNV